MRIFFLILITAPIFGERLHKITKLQRMVCKLMLRNEYSNLEEAQDRLNMLSFSESVFYRKQKASI